MPKKLRAHAHPQSLRIAVGLALCMAIGGNVRSADAQETPPDDVPAVEPAPAPAPDAVLTYWRQHREGWFWYRDPLPPKAPLPSSNPSTTPKKPQDLTQYS